MMAVAVRFIGATLAVETPKELFDSGYINGQHFLNPRPASNDALDATAAPIVVVLNWAEAVKK